MTINIEEFKEITPQKRRGVNSIRIENFLKKNRNKAFTSREIKEGIKDITIEAVNGALFHLAKTKILIHKSPYWAYNYSLDENEVIKK